MATTTRIQRTSAQVKAKKTSSAPKKAHVKTVPVRGVGKSEEAKNARNARKRFQRTQSRLEKARSETHNRALKAQYTQEINNIKKQISRTYAPKGGWKSDKQRARLEDAIRKGNELTTASKTYLRNSQAVRNHNFQLQLNWASSANRQAMSPYSEQEVKAFYRITEPIWNQGNIPISKRNDAIMEYFKTKDLQTAFERALSLPGVREKIEKEIRYQTLKDSPKSQWTEEQRQFYEDYTANEQGQNEGSPEWSMSLSEFNPDKSWKENISGEVNK